MSEWTNRRILITVRTYPVPARSGIEVSCTAGITESGDWIRLFPVPYRFLEEDQRFRKYQWIEVEIAKAKNDNRPESHKLRPDSIKIDGILSSTNNWALRRAVIDPLVHSSFCSLQNERNLNGYPTLGVIKPKTINRLIIEPTAADWTPAELALLRQQDLFRKSPDRQLEKIPFNFKYDFRCGHPACTGHLCTCTDWEMGQSFRRWQRQYGDGWEAAFRERYEREMIEKFDTHFYVGNLHQYPNAWIVVGLFYPPQALMGDLFA